MRAFWRSANAAKAARDQRDKGGKVPPLQESAVAPATRKLRLPYLATRARRVVATLDVGAGFARGAIAPEGGAARRRLRRRLGSRAT